MSDSDTLIYLSLQFHIREGLIFLCLWFLLSSKRFTVRNHFIHLCTLVFRHQDEGLNVTVWGKELLVGLAHRRESYPNHPSIHLQRIFLPCSAFFFFFLNTFSPLCPPVKGLNTNAAAWESWLGNQVCVLGPFSH